MNGSFLYLGFLFFCMIFSKKMNKFLVFLGFMIVCFSAARLVHDGFQGVSIAACSGCYENEPTPSWGVILFIDAIFSFASMSISLGVSNLLYLILGDIKKIINYFKKK